jgi:hypothetical protein
MSSSLGVMVLLRKGRLTLETSILGFQLVIVIPTGVMMF